MKIFKISPFEAFWFQNQEKIPDSSGFNGLLVDEYFHLGLAYLKNGKPVKRVYLPLDSPRPFSESFALLEILPGKNGFHVRTRSGNQVRGREISPSELSFFLGQNLRYYTTFSLEESLLDYPLETIAPQGFSLLNFYHEAVKNTGPLKKIAIVADPAGNLEAAYQEGLFLFEFFRSLLPDIPVSLIASPLPARDFDSLLSESSVVHFAGHIEEKGLDLGKEFYHPAACQTPLPPLLFLNGCRLPLEILKSFIRRGVHNMIYHRENQKDGILNPKNLKYFYLGILCGYRIGDAARASLDFSKIRLYGWMTNRFLV